MNIALTAGTSEGGKCANCFVALSKGERCLVLEIKKIEFLLVSMSHREEVCVMCEVSLLDEHGRAHVALQRKGDTPH